MLTTDAAAPDRRHREWLIDRNRVHRSANEASVDDLALTRACAELNRLEALILDTPAATIADVRVKTMLSVHLIAEGHCIAEDTALAILAEAAALATGMEATA